MKHLDLYAGLGGLAYIIVTIVLNEQGAADLSEYIAQPQAVGVFTLAALTRWYKGAKEKEK
jgi:hypothetical protein